MRGGRALWGRGAWMRGLQRGVALPGGEGDSGGGCLGGVCGGWGQGYGVRGRRSEGPRMWREQYRVRGGVQRYCALLGWKEGFL